MDKIKVLLVDDEKDVSVLTAKLLRASGYEVNCYFDGLGAIDVIRTTRPDVVLMDIRLPNVSGGDIYREMQADGVLKSIPVIFFSASASDRQQYSELVGAERYIEKPFELQTLLEAIKCAIEDRRGKTP